MLEFNIGGRPTRTQCQYTLQDANLDDLNQWSSKIFDKLKTIPELRDVATGSSFDRAAFVALIGKGRATMMFTDPPYNVPIHDHVPIHGHASGLGAVHHRPFPMASSEMDGAQFTRFLGDAFRNLAVFSVDGSIHFVCMDWRHLEELLVAGHGVYGEVKNLCVRVKDNAGMGCSTAAGTSSSWCSRMAGGSTATTSSSAGSGEIAATCRPPTTGNYALDVPRRRRYVNSRGAR